MLPMDFCRTYPVRERRKRALQWSDPVPREPFNGNLDNVSTAIAGDTGRKRKYYRLRPDGRRALAEERRQWDVVNTALTKVWRPA